MAKVFIGAAAGFAGDRSDAGGPVVDALAAASGPRFLMYETLAERTLALCQLERRQNPQRGFSLALERMLPPVLPRCLAAGIKIIGNFGAANPAAAARRVAEMARALGLRPPRIAAVEGDDIAAKLSAQDLASRRVEGVELARAREIISANLYLGAQPIAQALDQGADIVVTGRVADSALALGPLLHAFRWSADDWDRLAAGTLAGHLLECGAQVTGGYFADPGYKDVPGLAEVGYPIAEVDETGEIVITKPAGTGGVVDRLTVIEQMLYEIHDPSAYLAPDVVLDLSEVEVAEIGKDRVRDFRCTRQTRAGNLEGDGLRRWWIPRRSRDFLCRSECRGARAARCRGCSCARAQARSASATCESMRSVFAACGAQAARRPTCTARRPMTSVCALRPSQPMLPKSKFCSMRPKRFIARAPPAGQGCADASRHALPAPPASSSAGSSQPRVTMLGAPA